MTRRLFSILILVFILGCSSKDNRYDDIDFIAYSLRIWNMGKEWQFICTTYAYIDNKGQCKLIVHRYYPKPEITYCKIEIDRDIINKILDASKSIQKDFDLRPKVGISMYDGPSLKIKINKNDDCKTIHFYDNDEVKALDFIKLYKFISTSFMSNKYILITDTTFLSEKKRVFVNYLGNLIQFLGHRHRRQQKCL